MNNKELSLDQEKSYKSQATNAQFRPLKQVVTEVQSVVTAEHVAKVLAERTGLIVTAGGNANEIQLGKRAKDRKIVVYRDSKRWWDFRYNTGGDIFNAYSPGDPLKGDRFCRIVFEAARELGVETGAPETQEQAAKLAAEHAARLRILEEQEQEREKAEKKELEKKISHAAHVYESWGSWANGITGNPRLTALMRLRAFPDDLLSRFQNIGFAESESKGQYTWIGCDSLIYACVNEQGACTGVKSVQYDIDGDGGRMGKPWGAGCFKFELKPAGARDGVCILCEGETDAIAAALAGYHSISAKCQNYKSFVDDLPRNCAYWAILDNDDGGNDQLAQLRNDFERAGLTLIDARAALGDKNDLNDLWRDTCREISPGCTPIDADTEKGARDIVSAAIEAAADTEKGARDIVSAAIEVAADTDTAPEIDVRDAEQVRAYFLNKAEQNQTKAEKITMYDPVFGEFIKLVDPYRMRSYAPEFCIAVFGTAYLSNYRINAPSNPRIINLVARSSGGKDWTLGTHKNSRSLFWQLKEFGDIDVYKSADASITGNGMSKAAFLWAADPKNKGRILGKFRTEFGNAQTRGYGVVERAGSIGNYDIAICDGEISKPENKADQKELQGYNDSYPLSAFEVRAFQDINGAQVVSPRLRGTGEARRESWFAMKSPLEDPICTDENAPFIEAVLKESAFMPRECSRAFKLLKQNCLTINPFVDDYTQPIEIDLDTKSDEFINAYRYTLDTVHNQFYRANRCELLRDKLAFYAGLSAGMHLRATAIEDDYWIAAYFCECLSNSLDLIFECAGTVDDPDSEIAKIMQRVTDAGARGVRRERLSGNKKLLDELCGKHTDRNGVAYYEEDAPLVVLRDTDKRGNPNHYFYFLKENVSEAKQRNPNLR